MKSDPEMNFLVILPLFYTDYLAAIPQQTICRHKELLLNGELVRWVISRKNFLLYYYCHFKLFILYKQKFREIAVWVEPEEPQQCLKIVMYSWMKSVMRDYWWIWKWVLRISLKSTFFRINENRRDRDRINSTFYLMIWL